MLESRIYLSGKYPEGGYVFNRSRVYPIYGSDIEISKERASGERYFREKLEGSFTFQNEAYTAIRTENLNVEWTLEVMLYDTNSGVEKTFGIGSFTKDECTFNDDDKTCKIEIATQDRYSQILSHLDDKFNLVKIAPGIKSVTMTKRAILQLYMIGDSKITNVLGNISYETDSQEITDESKLTGTGDTDYHFAEISSSPNPYVQFVVSEDISDLGNLAEYLNEIYYSETSTFTPGQDFYYYNQDRTKIIKATWQDSSWRCTFVDSSDEPITFVGNTILFGVNDEALELALYETRVLLTPAPLLNTFAQFRRGKVYSRLLIDVDETSEIPSGTYKRAVDDIVASNMNYRYVRPASTLGGILLRNRVIESSSVQDEPTEYGIDSNGKYFVRPSAHIQNEHVLPIAWNMWIPNSFWFASDPILNAAISQYDCPFVLKDAYPLRNVINRLLENIDVGVTMGNSTFLDSSVNPVSGINQSIFITPITNVKKTYYEQAAQKGDISLKDIFEMLKTVFQCYWYIDSQNRLRIEHISWFKNGGSYQSDSRVILLDTTTTLSPRHGKPWSFGQNAFEYETENLPRRYEFGWPSDTTEPFKGISYDIKQTFLRNNSVQSNVVKNFFSDLDLIISTPDTVSDDLFALIAAENGIVPIVQQIHYPSEADKYTAFLQNGWLSFDYLFRYYLYDLSGSPISPRYEGSRIEPISRARALVQRNVEFPYTIDLFNRDGLITTGLGNGEIKKISLNLSSLMAKSDLEYDTE